ncbi:hypothetical protein C7M61_000841 [Candidozyma pseudohaemuli]|uniref:Uncharacterized protein n=1 Tax=Candidozyma pseudohaemuli TaxID=418784 RepID=A0A2P7YYX3_9ASCO|nr:hypothetical protein C7M61_000841 [[Candida] pseudohaemulonii]PSK41167.1 hypothetical protein C7M61_000841 [[Candida] pseudohaemulonii]
MQISKLVITTLAASTAVSATPVANNLAKRDDAVDVVLKDVEDLLGTADAGLNVTSVLEPILQPLGLKKREEELAALETRDLSTILSDVDGLVSDILKGVGKISADLLGL